MSFADPMYRDPVYGQFRFLLEYGEHEVPMFLHPRVVEATRPEGRKQAVRYFREHDIGMAVERALSHHEAPAGAGLSFPVEATFHDNKQALPVQVHVDFADGVPQRIRVDPPAVGRPT